MATLVFAAAWLAARATFEIDVRFSDVPLYRRYGEAIVAGGVPYRDVELEYPPGALPFFVVPALLSDDLAGFRLALEALLVACAVGVLVAMHTILVRLNAGERRSWAALLLVAASPLLLGPILAERYDLWPAALVVLALASALRSRHRTAGAALALGTVAKFFPLVVLPLLGWWAWRRDGRDALVRLLTTFALVTAASAAPFIVAAPASTAEVGARQIERPLQIESLGAALLLALHHGVGVSLGVESSYGSINLGGAKAATLALAQSILLLLVLLAIWWRFARARPAPATLVVACTTAVTAVVVLGKVLSPQFLVWALPLVALVGGRSGLTASASLVAACLTTQLIFPSRYLELIRLEGSPSLILAVRNVLLASALVILGWTSLRATRRLVPSGAGEVPHQLGAAEREESHS